MSKKNKWDAIAKQAMEATNKHFENRHKKIFIDCGFHHGEGLRHFINTLNIGGPDWLVMAFEPNPECHMKERLLKILSEFPNLKTIDGYPMAVWTQNCLVSFRQENVFESESGSPLDGRSIRDGWLSQIDMGADIKGLEAPITVQGVNISALIQAMAIHSKEIYMKMDIEGAEFPVLRKLLADDTAKHIKKMWVEFHERFVPGESHQTKRTLIEQLSLQTEIIEWN